MLYFCDPDWYDWHKDKPEFVGFAGQTWTQKHLKADKEQHKAAARIAAERPDIRFMPGKHNEGLCTTPNVIHYGSNGGHQAINLLYHLCATTILLIGYDMQRGNDGRIHWFGDHPNKVCPQFANLCCVFDRLAVDTKREGLNIINCTPGSALTCFPKRLLSEVLEKG